MKDVGFESKMLHVPDAVSNKLAVSPTKPSYPSSVREIILAMLDVATPT